MLSDRTKVVRGVMAFLAACAVLGLFMGLRGAMPGNVDPDYETGAPVSTPSGVVVEAAPVADNALIATTATNEAATNAVEEEEEEEAATEAPAAPTPAPAAPVTPAPKEEAPPADPVGELIEAPAPAPAPPIGDLY